MNAFDQNIVKYKLSDMRKLQDVRENGKSHNFNWKINEGIN